MRISMLPAGQSFDIFGEFLGWNRCHGSVSVALKNAHAGRPSARNPLPAPARNRCVRTGSHRCLPGNCRRQGAIRLSRAAGECPARCGRRGRGRPHNDRRISARRRPGPAGRNGRARQNGRWRPTKSLPPPLSVSMPILSRKGPVTFLERPTRML